MSKKFGNEVENCKTLEELFELWKIAQNEDLTYTENNYEIAKFISKDSFCLDGVINPVEWDNKNQKVLYILLEANVQKEIEEAKKLGYAVKATGDFWFKKVANNECVGGIIKSRLVAMQNIIENNIDDKPVYNKNNTKLLQNISYMNINKRGGFSSSKMNLDLLNDYCKKYQNFIRKEIEIINPDLIIACGTVNLIPELNNFTKIVTTIHPSVRWISNKEYITNFVCNLNNNFM